MLNKEYEDIEKNIYDCVVIGSGPSSEPVIFHLSKSGLKTLVIDGSDISSRYDQIIKKNIPLSRITPKLVFSNLKINNRIKNTSLNSSSTISSYNFNYLYSKVSGGLSPFWGGGLFEWNDNELKMTTTIETNLIRSSYKSLRKRLLCGSREMFFKNAPFAARFYQDNLSSKNLNFKVSEFLFNSNGIKNHRHFREEFDQHLIWNSALTIREYIQKSYNISYSKNIEVHSIFSIKKIKVLNCKSSQGDLQIKTNAVFLCAGTVNSTCLAFSALDMKSENFDLMHTSVAIAPLIKLGKVDKLSRKNIDIPDITWSYTKTDMAIPESSGYIISSAFLYKKLQRIFDNNILHFSRNLFSSILSKIAFVTMYRKNESCKTNLYIRKNTIKNPNENIYDIKITSKSMTVNSLLKCINNFIDFNNNIIRKWQVIIPLIQVVRNGGDVHYTSTMPQNGLKSSPITTNELGEINGISNIFVCDPSRLSYLSTLPHTFTSMAIADASLPKIIKKLKNNL